MKGINPVAEIQAIASDLDLLDELTKVDKAMDDVEFLMELLDPELHGMAYDLMNRLKEKRQILS